VTNTGHSSPESCGGVREDAAEALTGEDAGEPLSREMTNSGLPTPSKHAEGNTGPGVKVSPGSRPRGRRTSACIEASWMGTERSPDPVDGVSCLQRAEKTEGRTSAVIGPGKSDESVVSKKPANEDLPLWAWAKEQAEKRDSAKRNLDQDGTSRTQSRKYGVSPVLAWVREKAKVDKKMKFTSLYHHLDPVRLRNAFERLQPKAAPGVDGEIWKEFREQKEVRLKSLFDRLQKGTFLAKPARRVYIPKPDGRQRPLGIAALEDKIVQGAVVEVLNAIYEEDFLGFSYGFRPGRSPHRALDAWATALKVRKVNWVLDLDIRSYFDKISHEWLAKFLQHRIADQKMLRLIQKWLRAGVLEGGEWKPTEMGSPQGATVSPLLANVYLHYVFDLWAEHWRKSHAGGDIVIVRFADDAVIGFEREEDARDFLKQLNERMAKFQLELNTEKTRLIRFGRFAAQSCQQDGRSKPETMAFLGFTHICGRSANGKFQLLRHTIAKRQKAKLKEIGRELKARRHDPIPAQGQWLRQVVTGYYNYYGVPTNIRSLVTFRIQVTRRWLHALRRRSQRSKMNWERIERLSDRWVPTARICHPWPQARFDATTQGKSRVR
jgi:RNA-directed DNA polymerase